MITMGIEEMMMTMGIEEMMMTMIVGGSMIGCGDRGWMITMMAMIYG